MSYQYSMPPGEKCGLAWILYKVGSPDETKWNPGLLSKARVVPYFALRHPGYMINKSENSIRVCIINNV
jgi:hypothetical protein